MITRYWGIISSDQIRDHFFISLIGLFGIGYANYVAKLLAKVDIMLSMWFSLTLIAI